jgi:CDGSH-type Zn-finger protein
MADVKITVRLDGPLRIDAPEGAIEIVDHEGNPHELRGKREAGQITISLCRCGASAKKPYCDGTHKSILGEAAPAAGAAGAKPQA